MKYKVHTLRVSSSRMEETLQQFLNGVKGEVVSIIPNVRPTFQFMGATAKIDKLLIVEKRLDEE